MRKSLLARFFDFVEIRTKITSVFAFIFMLVLGVIYGAEFKPGLLLCYFFSMFLFDLCTTAINNLIGYKQGTHKLGFSYQISVGIIIILLVLASASGLILAANTGLVVLLLGALCFLCGILYTLGPIPISALPFGEVLSGIFYGFLIPLIGLSFMLPDGYFLSLTFTDMRVYFMMDLGNILLLILFCVAPMFTTSNIMLANNTSDLEEDIQVGRHTLVYYIGKQKALILFLGSYLIIYLAYSILFFLQKINIFGLLFIMISLYPVIKNTKVFLAKQKKQETFVVSVKNYVIIMSSIIVGLFASFLL